MSSGPPSTHDRVIGLVEAALNDADDPTVPTSALARKALRIARLRNDWAAVLWLLLEQREAGQGEASRRAVTEVAPHFTTEEFNKLWSRTTEDWIERRSIAKDQVLGQALGEAEAAIAGLREQVSHMVVPPGMEGVDLYFESQRIAASRAELVLAVMQREQIVARVRVTVGDYLSQTERDLAFGRVTSEAWERNRQFVDAALAEVAPQALEQFAAAYRRLSEGGPEDRAHALTSCRRVLKTLADALYPASGTKVAGVDGVDRKMTDDRFVMRLCQFVGERAEHSSSRELLASQVRELGQRLDALNSMASKGVHASVSQAEVDHCVIQTYLTVGDLLRLQAGTSAMLDQRGPSDSPIEQLPNG